MGLEYHYFTKLKFSYYAAHCKHNCAVLKGDDL